MVASLDKFIKKRVIKNILFIPKRSRLLRKSPVRLSYGRNKMAAKPFESRTNIAGSDKKVRVSNGPLA
jgi:hypothetical protein